MTVNDNSSNFFEKQYQQKKRLEQSPSIWYRLDNASTLFTLVSSARITCMYRLLVTLSQPIKISMLQIALENIMPRFPYFDVHLRSGFFWNYWEQNPEQPIVKKETSYPNNQIPINKKGTFPFQVKAYRNRLAVEFHHSLTDGTGSITFIRALIAEYLSLLGIKTNDYGDLFRTNQLPNPEEFEDAFKKYYKKTTPNPRMMKFAHHLPYKLEPKGVYNVISGIIPLKVILSKVKEKGVSLTEYLSAIYLSALQDIVYETMPERKIRKMRPLRLMVPVNLRNIYKTKTMRNFSLWVMPEIDPRLGKYEFDEILKQVHYYMRKEVCEKYADQQIARNIRGQRNPIVRFTPLFVKKLLGLAIYNVLGEYLYTGVLTNLGKTTLPEELEKHIKDIQFYPAPSPVTKTGCAIGSFGEYLYINFGRIIKETTVEKLFFRKITEEGIPVRIETN